MVDPGEQLFRKVLKVIGPRSNWEITMNVLASLMIGGVIADMGGDASVEPPPALLREACLHISKLFADKANDFGKVH